MKGSALKQFRTVQNKAEFSRDSLIYNNWFFFRHFFLIHFKGFFRFFCSLIVGSFLCSVKSRGINVKLNLVLQLFV